MLRREGVTPRRRISYPNERGAIVVPLQVWRRTVEELRAYAPSRSEGLVFWGGVVSGSTMQVTGLYCVRHAPQGGRVRLTADESRWLVRRLSIRDEKLVAQVHSHPKSAFHSPGDDQRAASFHPGFLSIVAPGFAVAVHDVTDCVVFEFDGHAFRELASEEVIARFVLASLFEERLVSPPSPPNDARTTR